MKESDKSTNGISAQGNSGLELSVGSIRTLFRIQDKAFLCLLNERYRAFNSTGPYKYDLIIDVKPLSYFVERDLVSKDTSVPRMKAYTSNGNLIIARTKVPFKAIIDTVTGRGIVRILKNDESFDNFLRVFYSLVLAGESGILLHAHTITNDGQGMVFLGGSDIDESTMARISSSGQVLTDGLVLIRNYKGEFYVFGTPFGNGSVNHRSNSYVPLKGLYLLKRDTETYLYVLPQLTAVQELYSYLFLFEHPPSLLESISQTCSILANNVPICELHLQQDGSLEEIVPSLIDDNHWKVCGFPELSKN